MPQETDKTTPTLAVACGGTGGHFYPGLSIAIEFRELGGNPVLFIGGHHMQEQLEIAAERGLDAVPAPAVRLPRSPLSVVAFPFRMLGCIAASRAKLRRKRIDVALGMGSWASVPFGLAVASRRIPFALHEGNACLGQANRFLSRWATLLGLSFPLRDGYRTKAKQVVVGMPIRQEIVDAGKSDISQEDRDSICNSLGLDPADPIILAFGGSQGAPSLNKAMREAAEQLPDTLKQWQILHLTGRDENDELVAAYESAGITACVKPRDPAIHKLYQIADAIVCRAGASTILELAIIGKPALMVPYPHAKEDHQTANAETVVEAGGGWVLPDRKLNGQAIIEHLVTKKERTHAAGIRKFAHPNAAKEMAQLLMELAAK